MKKTSFNKNRFFKIKLKEKSKIFWKKKTVFKFLIHWLNILKSNVVQFKSIKKYVILITSFLKHLFLLLFLVLYHENYFKFFLDINFSKHWKDVLIFKQNLRDLQTVLNFV